MLFIGKLYLYLGQREFISCEGELDDIKGIAFVPEHVGDLKGNIHSSKKKKLHFIHYNFYLILLQESSFLPV